MKQTYYLLLNGRNAGLKKNLSPIEERYFELIRQTRCEIHMTGGSSEAYSEDQIIADHLKYYQQYGEGLNFTPDQIREGIVRLVELGVLLKFEIETPEAGEDTKLLDYLESQVEDCGWILEDYVRMQGARLCVRWSKTADKSLSRTAREAIRHHMSVNTKTEIWQDFGS